MKVIHKYRLPVQLGWHTVKMPWEAEILKIGWQRNREEFNQTDLCIWAKVKPDAELVCHQFYICTTGNETAGDYIDSVMNNDGQYILHIFKDYIPL